MVRELTRIALGRSITALNQGRDIHTGLSCSATKLIRSSDLDAVERLPMRDISVLDRSSEFFPR